MFVLSTIFSVVLALTATTVIVTTVRRYLPLVGDLRRSLLQPPETAELRLRIQDLAIVPHRNRARRRRHLPRPKPVRHRLHGRGFRHAIA